MKKPSKDIVSKAIVEMPCTFAKPLDYSVDLLLRSDQHPSLREYISIPAQQTSEVDPAFALYPQVRNPLQAKDEIELRMKKLGTNANQETHPQVSATYSLGLAKTVSGSFVNNLDIPTALLPGNFGARVVDGILSTNQSDVYRERKNTHVTSFVCDNSSLQVPALLPAPAKVDYLTDDESDDNAGFELKVPSLDDLIHEFEKEDDMIQKTTEDFKSHLYDLKVQGFQKQTREEIKHSKTEKTQLLDQNISAHKQKLAATLPGMLEDVNETIKNPKNKIYSS